MCLGDLQLVPSFGSSTNPLAHPKTKAQLPNLTTEAWFLLKICPSYSSRLTVSLDFNHTKHWIQNKKRIIPSI